jgi:hypothetical protein
MSSLVALVLRNEDAQKRQRIFSCAVGKIFVLRAKDGAEKSAKTKCAPTPWPAKPLFIAVAE